MNLGHTKRVMDWNGKECDAPDIAFVSIPEVDGRDLEAKGAIFYNLGLVRDFKPGTAGNRMSTCYALVGVVGEWTEDGSTAFTKGRKIDIGGLFGAAKSVRPLRAAIGTLACTNTFPNTEKPSPSKIFQDGCQN